MRIVTFVKSCAIIGISVAMAACLSTDVKSQRPSPQVGPSPAPRENVDPSPAPNSGIRSIDFANFTYPAKPVYSEATKSFTLLNGKYRGKGGDPVGLVYLAYGDATGDGEEEAMAVLSISVNGTAIPYVVYVFTMKDSKPTLLWGFSSGDRADGGLRQVYAENTELIVELYGKGKFAGGDLYAEDGMTGGACCPTHFTRARYKWNGEAFQRMAKEEILPNPVGGAAVIMQRYRL
jgi:hypothetical protein